MLALVGAVSAQEVLVPVDGNVMQSISISTTGTISAWSLTPGITNTNSAVHIIRNQNVPTRLLQVDALDHGKLAGGTPGYMCAFDGTNYYSGKLAAKLQLQVPGGTLQDLAPSTPATLLAAGGTGTIDDTLTVSQAVSMSDVVLTTQTYHAVIKIDAALA